MIVAGSHFNIGGGVMGKIVHLGNRVLWERCEDVTSFDKDLARTIRRLQHCFKSKEAQPAIGLAAPQIGISKRIFVATLDVWLKEDCGNTEPEVFINPKIVGFHGALVAKPEGCLSVNRKTVPVMRYPKIDIVAQDESGHFFERTLTNSRDKYPASVYQHELDHLDGILVTDRARMQNTKSQRRALREIAANPQFSQFMQP